MKTKLISVIMCVVIMISMLVMCGAAAEKEPDLTLDFNKRYTDILEYDEVSDPYLDTTKNSEEKQQKRDIYVVVLVVLLIIAIIVFVYTLRKVPAEKELERKKKPELDSSGKKQETTLADEEKQE